MPRDPAPHTPAQRLSTVRLAFRPHEEVAADLTKPIGANLSVIERVGRTLFTASDEGARIERLATHDGAVFGEHASYALADFFKLPAGAEGEADVEGLCVDPGSGGWLWVVGSHSLARSKPKPDEDDATACLERLTEVRRDPNRCLLGRIPLVEVAEGLFEPVRADGERTAACLKMGRKRNALAKRLRRDDHIGRFIGVPAKENGFDVEGIAARDDRVFLGLRGPVLRGWACILELTVRQTKPHRLRLCGGGPDDEAYRKHFVDLDGLGVRELAIDGNDLLILAGPTMDLDGPVSVYRWAGALASEEGQVVPRDHLVRLLDVPFGAGCDHAEGIARLERPGAAPLLMVAYDSPAPDRRHDGGTAVDADLFELPTPRLFV
ncbi:DUF3616 domain-containing protein [Azospirillum sp.]|uniref:DUF3616 domain-containing protein n=1 Tax=Azospirillum sp. TaxID=34012 RepID=UPI002D744AD4|nr:DUF3616 domain-containing protein [Azospirillum sp.]HYD65966.1 DUF3616 domain-containing protein [Azospirillum sp.]